MLLLCLALAQDDAAFAGELVDLGYFDLAEEIYARTPDSRESRLGLATIRLRQGRAAEAVEAYRGIPDATSELAHALRVLARTTGSLGPMLEGRDLFPAEPATPESRYERGEAIWAICGFPGAPVDEALDELIRLDEEFGWRWGDLVYLFPVSTRLGRAYRLKARRTGDEGHWGPALSNFSVWRRLLETGECAEVAESCAIEELRALVERRRAKEAEALARRTLVVFPSARRVRVEHARTLYELGRVADAREALRGIDEGLDVRVTYDPDPESVGRYARRLAESGRPLEAVGWFQKIGDSLNVGHCYFTVGRYHEALAAYELAGDVERAERCRRVLFGSPVDRAWDAYEAKRYEEAIRLADASEEGRFVAALAAHRAGHADALERFEAHAALGGDVHRRMASLCFAATLAEPARALALTADWNRAASASDRLRLLSRRIDLHLSIGDVAGAEADLVPMLEAYDASTLHARDVAASLLAVARALGGERAAEYTSRAIAIHMPDGDRVTIALAQFEAGRFLDAARLLRDHLLTESVPVEEREAIEAKIGDCCAAAGRLDEAIEAYQRLATDDKFWAREELAGLYVRKFEATGDAEWARRAVDHYAAMSGGRTEFHYRMRLKYLKTLFRVDPDAAYGDLYTQVLRGWPADDPSRAEFVEFVERARKRYSKELPNLE